MNITYGQKKYVFDMSTSENRLNFTSSIEDALSSANDELTVINETIQSIGSLTPDCDATDYAMAIGSGALCGILDIFLVGKPGESTFGEITDEWFRNRTKDFAKWCGWDNKNGDTISSAIRYLEKKFKIPYDQRGAGDAASFVFDLGPENHHFKSLGHNPTLLGLFFSILDQYRNTSHFVSGGELIALEDADGRFELRGKTISAKLFCGFVNWFGHLVSDASGSSSSKGRGMGLPSPIWAWVNDAITILRTLHLPAGQFSRSLNELAIEIYKQGFDARFQTAQLIPVVVNEFFVRILYSARRLLQYFKSVKPEERSFEMMWNMCAPFSNPTIKRMLTIAHGTFCMLDLSDATIRGFISGAGSFNISEFVVRVNVAGVSRFSVSLYGEVRRGFALKREKENVRFALREKAIVDDYIGGLHILAELYNDQLLLDFVSDLETSGMYTEAFAKSARLAEMRKVPEKLILKDKADIDSYFKGETR